MSHSKLKIEFHPHRLSRSGSREKFSPYRSKQRRIENEVILQESKQRLDANEPIIKFRRLIDPTASKKRLKINNDGQKMSKETYHHQKSSQKIKESAPHQDCMNCGRLMRKIEEQTALMNENLREINKNIKFPRVQEKEEVGAKQSSPDEHAENQRIIIHYLDELRNRADDITNYQNMKAAYEEQLAAMKILIAEWQMKYKYLEMELTSSKTNNSEDISAGQFPSNKTCVDASTSSKFIFKERSTSETKQEAFDFIKETSSNQMSNDSMKVILEDIMKRQGSDFQKIMGQLQQIKLENEMLREEVNLLNYALEEKQNKIEKLKSELFNFMRKAEQKSSHCKTAKSSNKAEKKKVENMNLRSLGVSIEWNIEEQKNRDLTVTNKKTDSFIISSRSNIFLNNLKQNLSESECSVDQKDRRPNMTKTSPISFASSQKITNKSKRIHDAKLNMAKSLLKFKKQESVITKNEKLQLEKQKKELQCFSENRMQDLDLIRRTLMHRFKGFKWTYQNIQNILLDREDPQIKYAQMKDLLAQYPFSLGKKLKQSVLEYILRQKDLSALQNAEIPCDLFCNRLRELIPDVQLLEEEEQMGLIEILKKKIYMFQEGIINECIQLQDRRGFITQSNLRDVLCQFKLSQLEISTFISQCCLLSSDADRLNYKQYLSIFDNDQ